MSTLREILARAPHVLLDFDGPVCAVFGGMSAATVAERLRQVLGQTPLDLPDDLVTSTDPFDVLRYAAGLSSDDATRVESALAGLEVAAVASAPTTPGAIESISSLRKFGHTVTIVSNNSVAAISAYLKAHEVQGMIDGIVARTSSTLSLIKPNPFFVAEAINARHTSAERCILVGDSISDIEAARAAGVGTVALANKVGKRQLFAPFRPELIIDSMRELSLG